MKGLVCVDTAPVMEKVWAQRAGLGWQGKHTNLISTDYGSWLFLGEIIIDLDFDFIETNQSYFSPLTGSFSQSNFSTLDFDFSFSEISIILVSFFTSEIEDK